MATNMQPFPRILKMLRENSNTKEKREALTYICSNSKKMESMNVIKEEQYKELCKLVTDAFANGNGDIQNEAYETLNVIIHDFKNHTLNLFDAMSPLNKKNRLKILKLLEVIEDNAISTVASDMYAVHFFNNCMSTVQTNTMPWIATTACTDNLEALIEAENKPLSDDQRLEEEIINYSIILLRRLYKVAATTSDIKIERFNVLLLDKIMVLAYMGHKRQRGPALQLLQQALATNILSHVRTKVPDVWMQYKTALQNIYCKRMLLLVSACESDWATQWNISIQFLGVDLHRGAGLINNLLSVEEKAFKSTDTIIRRQAFLSWKLLVDNFALDSQELATARRIKLLCIPLNAKNSKTELIALTKLEVWWHVIVKLYKDISKFVNPVITQFLNFCFGPLGDTPLLSSKFDIVASPGKRFFKTKIVAVDALCQLLVTKHENQTVFSPMLEERLPHAILDSVFQECYKSIIHSVGEVLLVLSQLTDAEMKNRYQLGKKLWKSLINYVQQSKMEKQELMYKDVILVITELTNYAVDKPMIKNLCLDVILSDIVDLSKNFNVQDYTLFQLLLKFLHAAVLREAKKNHYDALKCLLWQCIKTQKGNEYYPHAFKCLKQTYEKLHTLSNEEYKNETVIFELWRILAEVLTKYISDVQEINEGSCTEHNLKTVESIVIFPFMYICLEDQKQVYEVTNVWKSLYKQFEIHADLIATVKPNEILLNIASAMQKSVARNEKSYCLIANCLDILLSTVNYKSLLAYSGVPSIMHLITELITYSLSHKSNAECESALKALSAVLITIYGHDPQKVISYLQFCKSAVELILTSELGTLYKEIANTWETIISIFKGLNKLIDTDLILSYKNAIVQGLNHSNPEIVTQTSTLFEMKNSLSSGIKETLEEIEKEARKNKTSHKSEIIKNKKNDHIEKLPNQVKMVGSFLNRSASSPKTAIFREPDKTDKKLLSDSDSQDYVFIKTDLKFDVNRLTEHQIESLKRKREDIPALYNDLSQSSSQDTQNLQEWFDKKNKSSQEAEKLNSKKDARSIKNILEDDANKENKIDTEAAAVTDKSAIDSDMKSIENFEQNECTQKAKVNVDNNENSLVQSEKSQNGNTKAENIVLKNTVHLHEKLLTAERTSEDSDTTSASESITKDLNFSSQEEFAGSNDNDQRLSPSVLDNGKRHNRYSTIARPSMSSKSEQILNSQSEQSDGAPTMQRTLRAKAIQIKTKMSNRHKISGNMENKLNEEKRGVKRKSASDSESEGSHLRRRRKTISSEFASDSDSARSTESDNTTIPVDGVGDDGSLSQRTKNEISRLRINMVFDSPLPNRRRSKTNEDNNKDTSARKLSPETKGTKLKAVDTKIGDSVKRNLKTHDRKGRPAKGTKVTLQNRKKDSENEKKSVESKKGQENKQTEVTPKNLPDTKSVSVDIKKFGKTKNATVKNDVSNNETQNTSLNSNEKITTDKVSKSPEEELQTQDDMEDIIENSQDLINIGKKCNEKQCFIKINKIEDVSPTVKPHEATVEGNDVAGIIASNSDDDHNEIPIGNVKGFEEICDIVGSEPHTLTPTTENSTCDNEKEAQKVNEVSLVSKSLIGFSSPKTNSRRQLKFKPYSVQGRAAHMLGLVTKQAKMESESLTINIDDDLVTKKGKFKDTENELLSGKRERGLVLKEVDKITGGCSSRQEKIFNNMRTSDYCSLTPVKLFSNLKNDGERVFSKTDKSVDCVPIQTDSQVEKISEESPSELDELPMLEWSSANPPSLTASPSASILKRHRQSIPEPDPESTTPSKRKRVSFADPPVSKEMGYETATPGSPHRTSKFALRGLLGRKDSPYRLKQVKQNSIHGDSEKQEKEEEEMDMTNPSEVDLQCEKENELLTKIAEELEYSETMTIDTESAGSYNCEEDTTNAAPMEVDASNKIKIDNLSVEFEITQKSTFSKHSEARSVNIINQSKEDEVSEGTEVVASSIEATEYDDSETQEDIFNGVNRKYNDITDDERHNNVNSAHNTSDQNNSLDSLKFNITNDSVIDRSSEEHVHSESLEDTVDAQNLTGLNSTVNSDEIFCEKLIRTSTQAVENIEEQDTLPVTDSVFGSLPLSQDSQNTSEFSADISQPELLDSTQPIYSTLITCQESIKSIIEQLTYPLWIQHLIGYFANRNLRTIGDLAQLSEREVNRIPLKGNSKVELVKSVLQHFEMEHVLKDAGNAALQDSALKVTPEKAGSKLAEQNSGELVKNAIETEKTIAETSNQVMQHSSAVPDSCQQSLHESAQETTSSTSASSSNLSNTNTAQMTNAPVSSAVVSTPTSEAVAATSKSSVTHLMKTVGTCTTSDSTYLSKETPYKSTKSVAVQMTLEDLLDEIDVNLVLESAARRCTAEKILLQYKDKMRHVPQVELERQTINMLGVENRKDCNEIELKAACRASGVNKVLLRLPDIFSADKQFFVKVLSAYRKKIKPSDCLNILEFNEVKDAVCAKCTSSELAEMLSKKLKEDEQEGIKMPMSELSSLDAMLKRMPMDVIISHTVANDELIPSRVVLDIALQNNSPSDIAHALESQSSLVTKSCFDKLWSPQFAVEHIEKCNESKEDLLKIFGAVSSKLNSQELLQAFYESMNEKAIKKQEQH